MSLASRLSNALFPTTTTHKAEERHGSSDVLPGRNETQEQLDNSQLSHTMPPETIKMAETEGHPSYIHAMVAGGIGGTTGDLLMHSLDTVKTRQQGDPHFPPKYTTLSSSYSTIFRQEGIRRGLYGGWLPAMLGSFPGTVIFFGSYEYSKRHLIDIGCNAQISYLASGLIADLAASIVYVPSEVLKTRLQLQGRYNNPHFYSGYNYRGTRHALSTLLRTEGPSALFYGYKATIWRDLPFSALQFTFYEQFLKWSKQWKQSKDIGVGLEAFSGAAAGGLAGVMTCPLDVVKTRIQTQVNPTDTKATKRAPHQPTPITQTQATPSPALSNGTQTSSSSPINTRTPKSTPSKAKIPLRNISASSPSTHRPRPGAVTLDTSSILTGLKLIYKQEGIAGWFRGVGPRAMWTTVQSGIMLFCYQQGLKYFSIHWPLDGQIDERAMM